MKLIKMSLVAALLVGSSAFAIENTKVSGDVNLFVHTDDDHGHGELFDKDYNAGDASLNLNVGTDLSDTVTAGLGYTAISTLGLENNVASRTFGNAHTVTTDTGANFLGAAPYNGVKAENQSWMNEAWIAAKAGKTTLKLGRQALDTPLAFTETWSIEKNTFEAMVAINKDLPDTTLVGAYVGNGNGNEIFGQDSSGTIAALEKSVGGVVNERADFTTFGTDGAYAVGAINNSWKPLTAQLWYYNLTRLATAHWAQFDVNMNGIKFGLQNTAVTATGDGTKADTATAIMVGYEIKDTLHAKLAYSMTNEDGTLGNHPSGDMKATSNTATGSGASKLYTEAWWSYGYVTAADTTAITFDVEYHAHGLGEFGFYFTTSDVGHSDDHDMTEFTVTASKSYGNLDTTLAVVNETVGDADATNIVQAYLTYNF